MIAWIFGLVALGCAGYVLLTYGLAFLRPPDENVRRAHLLRAALVELFTTLLLIPLWPFWMVLGKSYEARIEGEGRAQGNRRPVILLHGLAMTQTQWVWVGRRLARRGLGPLYATTYFSPQPVRRSAHHLKAFVERVCAREDVERVDIVAHSLGGVVARYYLSQLGGARRVGRLVTIASPHKGTLLGRLGLVPSALEIHHDSELVNGLGFSPEVRYTSIWSRADNLVVPPQSASIAPAGEDRIFPDLGHLSMVLSPRVLDALAERLTA